MPAILPGPSDNSGDACGAESSALPATLAERNHEHFLLCSRARTVGVHRPVIAATDPCGVRPGFGVPASTASTVDLFSASALVEQFPPVWLRDNCSCHA